MLLLTLRQCVSKYLTYIVVNGLFCVCSCAESVVMLANIKQHAAYIASTVGYINDQILADDKIVLDAPVSDDDDDDISS